jgi:multisubunit Na+/H+ antiporter MnhB subunit
LTAIPTQRPMTRLVILDRSVRVLFHPILMVSLYLVFAGHNQPGGGFVGGLVAGAALAMQFVAGGIDEVRRLSRFRPWTILGTGLLVSFLTASVPLVVGDAVLTTRLFTGEVPILGTVKTTSALLFDLGVYFLVVGLVLMIFEAFGDEPATHPPPPPSHEARR